MSAREQRETRQLEQLRQLARAPGKPHPSTKRVFERNGWVSPGLGGACVLTDSGRAYLEDVAFDERKRDVCSRLTDRHQRLVDRALALLDAHDRGPSDRMKRWRWRANADLVLTALVLSVDPAFLVKGMDTRAGRRLHDDCASTLRILADFDEVAAEAVRIDGSVTVEYRVEADRPDRPVRTGAREGATQSDGTVDLASYRKRSGRKPTGVA